jgi:energy-coupling factor transporter ATP-binding protein EcfA2
MSTFTRREQIRILEKKPSALDKKIDSLIAEAKNDEIQGLIGKNLTFKYNSVNLLIGQRGSGKTHFVMRELIKLLHYPEANYTLFIYSSNKIIDDQTVEKFKPMFDNTFIEIRFVNHTDLVDEIDRISEVKKMMLQLEKVKEKEKNAVGPPKYMIDDETPYVDYENEEIFTNYLGMLDNEAIFNHHLFDVDSAHSVVLSRPEIETPSLDTRLSNVPDTKSGRQKIDKFMKTIEKNKKAKEKQPFPEELRGKISVEEYEKILKYLNIPGIEDNLPHTIIFIDDCIDLLTKRGTLFKKLFENRQPRITYFLGLQDVQGIPPSMKSNIDSLVLFGMFPKHKFRILFYQIPLDEDINDVYDCYKILKKNDYMLIQFESLETKITCIRAN